MTVLDHAFGEEQVPGLEDLELGQHTRVADRDRHRLEMGRRVDEDVRPHVHAAHVETADVGLELDHMAHPLGRGLDGGSRPRLLRVLIARHEARPWAGGEVDQHVAAALADPVHHLAIERAVHARAGGLRIAHMNVDDGCAGLGGVDGGLGDLCRRHGDRRVAGRRVRRARDRARDHHLALHVVPPRVPVDFVPTVGRTLCEGGSGAESVRYVPGTYAGAWILHAQPNGGLRARRLATICALR